MRLNFDPSLKCVLEDEGGNDDDPVDRGGRTSRGITQREYNAWCSLHRSPTGDVWRATPATIEAIYQQQYWLPYCDALPLGIDYMYFDMNVNHGTSRATKLLQQALDVGVDGFLGVVTMHAALNANPKLLIQSITEKRIAFYKAIEAGNASQKRFDRGWMNRASAVRTRALTMVS
jgi:lysozyme family protein